jgi:hypothetical protein
MSRKTAEMQSVKFFTPCNNDFQTNLMALPINSIHPKNLLIGNYPPAEK